MSTFLAGRFGSVNLPEHRRDVVQARLGRSLPDIGEEPLVDVDGIHGAAGRHGLRQRHLEQTRSGAEVRDDIAGLELKSRDDLIDPEARDAIGGVENLGPFFRGPRRQLPRGNDARIERRGGEDDQRPGSPEESACSARGHSHGVVSDRQVRDTFRRLRGDAMARTLALGTTGLLASGNGLGDGLGERPRRDASPVDRSRVADLGVRVADGRHDASPARGRRPFQRVPGDCRRAARA